MSIDDTYLREATWSNIVITVIFSFLFLLIVIGNVLALFVIYRRKSLQDPAGVALANLAVGDLLTSIPLLGSTIIFWIDDAHINPLACKILAFMSFYPFTIILWTTAWITFDRCFAVYHPFKYHRIITVKTVVSLLAIAWILLLVWCMIPLLSLGHGLGNYNYVNYTHSCWVDVGNYRQNGVFLLITYSAVLVLVIIVVLCYSILLIKARLVLRRITTIPTFHYPASSSLPAPSHKSVKTTLIVVGASLMCILPAVIIIYITIMSHRLISEPLIYNLFCFWTFYVDAALNPFIFGFSHKTFRLGYRKLYRHFMSKFITPHHRIYPAIPSAPASVYNSIQSKMNDIASNGYDCSTIFNSNLNNE
ncbi:Beta-2 adrenergic receptor [Trichoplax sp. H2]|uniref:G-protein coupled receptors family 1 profile domain-containing protein n=1 Tax=Trichoplax adhaerens TaxID=10228 RepID=B3RUP9_TRIAD|nr:hypothetical protein TRIADDRAFT_55368 [Trichoplax adhaerens]EDV25363.1 hypothetical protein TRIADDRAFT_55368 [Trichoplax adhaerens]RDD42910.1 Beta-2 adrenergic receptor [Trichoplax sp. H2]|eukprot:XP_002111396.1 hypothetical protein TRIADDRAFT_55368 [Trichoplax adhaerens]